MEELLSTLTPTQLADAMALMEQPARRIGLLSTLEVAARRIAACNRVVLIGPAHDALSDEDYRPLYLGNSSGLTAALLPLCKPEHLPRPGEATLIAARAAVRLPADAETTVLLVGTHSDAGCNAIAFTWERRYECDAQTVGALRALAVAASLALRCDLTARELRSTRINFQRHLGELQRRLRSVLALARSIVRRSMQSAESPEEFALHLEARISALSRVQAAIGSSGVDGVEMQDLLRTELTANAVREAQFELLGPSLRLRPREAETLGLAFHELVTNSLKFGALATPGSSTHIRWDIRSTATGSWLRFRWLEKQAPGAAPSTPRRGFGRELIEQILPKELAADTRFELSAQGLLCTIDWPLNACTANSIPLQQPHKAQETSNATSNPAAP